MSERRLRILHIALNLDVGGLERLIVDLAARGDAGRFETQILCLRSLGRHAERARRSAAVHLMEPMSRWSLVWPRALARRIRAIAPDVVHTHSGVWLKGARAARLARVPRVIHTDHGRLHPDPWGARLADGLASRLTDVVVAVSENLAERLRRTVVANGTTVTVVRNGVDTDAFRPRPDDGALRRSLAIPADAPVVGTVGRFDPIKGYDVMLRGFAAWHAARAAEGAAPVLVLVGDGPERGRLEAMAATLGLTAFVRFPGWVDDARPYYALFDVFSLSSHSEGTPLSLLEAMASGVCPLVTGVGGNPAVLGEALRHRLVPPGDAGALAAGWRRALLDDEARRRDAARARERVCEAYGLDGMVRAYETLYRGAA